MVGLLIKGRPVNEPGFIRVCRHFGCPEPVAKRVLKDLKREGERKLTLPDDVGGQPLQTHFIELGLTVTVIPPKRG